MNSTNFSEMFCSKHTQNGKKCLITHISINQKTKNPLFCQQCVKVFLEKDGNQNQLLTKEKFIKKYFVQGVKMYQKVGPHHKQTLKTKQKFLLDTLKTQFEEVEIAFGKISKFIKFSLNTLAQPFSQQQVKEFYHGKISAQKVQETKKKYNIIKDFHGMLQDGSSQNLNLMIQGLQKQLKIMTDYNKNKSTQIKKKLIEFMKNVGKNENQIRQNQRSQGSMTESYSTYSNIKIEHIQDQDQEREDPKHKSKNISQEEEQSMRKNDNIPSLFENSDIPKLPKKNQKQTQENFRMEEQNHKNEQRNRQKLVFANKGFSRQSESQNQIKQRPVNPNMNRKHLDMLNKKKQNQKKMSEQKDESYNQKRQKPVLINKQKRIRKLSKQGVRNRRRLNILRKLMVQGQPCYQIQIITKGLGDSISQIKIKTEKDLMKNHSYAQLIQAFIKKQI